MQSLPFLSKPRPLKHLLEQTRAMGFAMASEPLVGALLRSLAASKLGGRVLFHDPDPGGSC